MKNLEFNIFTANVDRQNDARAALGRAVCGALEVHQTIQPYTQETPHVTIIPVEEIAPVPQEPPIEQL